MIVAFSDVHGPRYMGYLKTSLDSLRDAELLVLAGDIVDKGETQHFKMVLDTVREVYNGSVIAIFGNEEYDERKEQLRCIDKGVMWLDDEMAILKVSGYNVAIIGTRGALDRPTRWQERNIPGIRDLYAKRLERLSELLKSASESAEKVILVTHYAPIGPTLEGENPKIWNQMGSRMLTRLILKNRVDVVLHGHAHNSSRVQAQLGATRVYNVALPAVRAVTRVPVAKVGLEAFL
jgi:Icc-related predicted phosphoesterase